MKQKIIKFVQYLLVILILGVTGYCAKLGGDKIATYASLKTFQSILKLVKPVHETIYEIQLERARATQFVRKTTDEDKLKDQIKNSNQAFQHYIQQLRQTDIRSYAIPESDVDEMNDILALQRKVILQPDDKSAKNLESYDQLVFRMTDFLKRIFSFGKADPFLNDINTFLSSVSYREEVYSETAATTLKLMHDLSLGDVQVLRQEFSNQADLFNRLKKNSSPYFKNTLEEIQRSPEALALFNFRDRFKGDEPDITGSPEISQEYQTKSDDYLGLLRKLESSMLEKLSIDSEVLKSKLINDMIYFGGIGLGLILLLIGIYILIRKLNPDD